ncbi:MAG TPA: recombination mediator RecR [Patescibacteria group bacterium]|nr:recombination mediator RecR [Patescibacteria group bacterium]
MKLPKAVADTIESFEKLPGIGPKSAQRLAFYLLHIPQSELTAFAQAIENLRKGTVMCSVCYTVAEENPCTTCSDASRDKSILCVVEQPLDVLALEKNGRYKGMYHVLHGVIDPLNNIGPDEIYIAPLVKKAKTQQLSEIILATNPTLEGEATAMYISKLLRAFQNSHLKVTRIGRGLPVGSDIEYADEITLQRALEGRSEMS